MVPLRPPASSTPICGLITACRPRSWPGLRHAMPERSSPPPSGSVPMPLQALATWWCGWHGRASPTTTPRRKTSWARPAKRLKPEQENGSGRGESSRELQAENGQGSFGISWQPGDSEVRDERNLTCHQQLPEMSRGALIRLAGAAVNRGVTEDQDEGGKRHRQRDQRARSPESHEHMMPATDA